MFISIYTHNAAVVGADKGAISLLPACPLYCVADYLDNERSVIPLILKIFVIFLLGF